MLDKIGLAAKEAAYQLASLNTTKKNKILSIIAESLAQQEKLILEANNLDIQNAIESGLTAAMLDRLRLTPVRLVELANDVRNVCNLADPIGQIIDGSVLESGLNLTRKRVPLGVVAAIYESRPNVTVDIAALCLKTGNAVILRGGKETIHTNRSIVAVIQRALECVGLPKTAVQFIDNTERSYVMELLRLDRYVNMIIPRGGIELHKLCKEHSTIPVIAGGVGVCHIFIDKSYDIEKALSIVENAKTQRPSTCNSVETLLVHSAITGSFLPELAKKMMSCNVILHACPISFPILSDLAKDYTQLIESDEYDREWLSLDLNVKIVQNLNEAIAHIRQHGTGHSDAILTRSFSHAEHFVRTIDSAAVYVNASTRFTDGAEFGLGAEVAVSTQKLHARGPMGLEALTTYKWIGYGDDLIRR